MHRISVVLVVMVLFSCQKAQRDEDTAVNTCQDISLAQTIFADAYKQIRFAAENAEGISDVNTTLKTIFGCEEIIVDTLSNPKTVTIDYKFIGCEGLGVERNGRVIGEFFGNFKEENSALDITFSNYYFKGFEVSGKVRVIFKANTGNTENHTFYVQDGNIYDGQSTMSWTSSQNWAVTTGSVNEYSFTGGSNGVNRKGNIFKAEITEDNVMSDDCLYVTKGKMDVDVRNISLRKMNYGNGSCDDLAEVTINGGVYSMRFP